MKEEPSRKEKLTSVVVEAVEVIEVVEVEAEDTQRAQWQIAAWTRSMMWKWCGVE